MLNVRDIFEIEEDVLGPSKRIGVWFQGCSIRCSFCMVPESWAFEPKKLFMPKELLYKVREFGIKEITISGGEPFDQERESFFQFLKLLKEDDFGVICYSGYTIKELIKFNFQEHLKLIDLLIDGRYIIEKDFDTAWRGSVNQRFVILSDRYKDNIIPANRKVQIYVKDGKYIVIGIAKKELIKALQSKLSVIY